MTVPNPFAARQPAAGDLDELVKRPGRSGTTSSDPIRDLFEPVTPVAPASGGRRPDACAGGRAC